MKSGASAPDRNAPSTFWNGEPAKAVRGTAVHDGERIPAVQVAYAGEVFYLSDVGQLGWWKVTVGHGSPRYGHQNVIGDGWHAECEASDCLECHILRLKRKHGEPLAGPRCAEALPEHLRAAFWNRQTDRFFAGEAQ